MTNRIEFSKGSKRVLFSIFMAAVFMVVSAAGLATVYAAGGDDAGSESAGGDDVVLTVNGVSITKEDFYSRMEQEVGLQILQQMIAEKLLIQAADDPALGVTEEKVSARFNQIKASFGDEQSWKDALAAYKITEERLRDEIKMSFALEALSVKDIVITEDELQAYFEANKDSMGTPEQIRASHILVDTQEEAEAILAELNAGADFAAIAAEKSLDTGSKASGGDLGYFTRGQMIPEFEQAAFSLQVGELSAPVQSQYGWHLIKLTDRKPAVPAVYEEVKDQIKETLTQQKAKSSEDVINELMKAADISVMWEQYSVLNSKQQ